MIVFSLTLFLFSSFTFFYKIRISKKPRTPRSTTWWVCLFKQCQCSCSGCTDIGVVGGCTSCPSCLGSLVEESTLPEQQPGGCLDVLTLPFPCLFPWTCRDCFPVSPLPLCQMCFQLLGGCRGVGQNSWAAPLEVKPKTPCCALASSAIGTFQFFPEGFLVPPRIPKPLGMQKNEADFVCLISPVWEPMCWKVVKFVLSGSCRGLLGSCWWQPCSAIAGGTLQPTSAMGTFQWKHSSSTSAPNKFLCYGEMRWLFSPVTVKPGQSYHKNTQSHCIAIHNSSMSTLLTCQIVNPFQLGMIHEFSLQLFHSLE